MGTADRRRPGRTAAAVLLLLVVLGALLLLLRGPRALVDLGGPAIRPITSPVTVPGRPVILAWEGAGPPYGLSLQTEAGDPVWRVEQIPRPMVRLPDELRARLTAGRYRWRVDGRDAGGRPYESDWFPLTLSDARGRVLPAAAQRRR